MIEVPGRKNETVDWILEEPKTSETNKKKGQNFLFWLVNMS